jgi:hypothetical protein
MLKKLLIAFSLYFSILAAQAQLVQVSGYVFTHDSSGVVPFANIYNKKTKTGTQATIEGFYTVLVAPGDSVEITAIGYQKSILSLPKGFVGSTFHYDVPLKHLTYSLPTFTKYYIDMEIFTREFTAMEVPEEKRYITVDKGQITSKTPVPTNFGVTLNGPFSWLYNKFSRKAKEMQKLADLRSSELENYTANQRLTPTFISLATGLPEDKTMDLAAYCDISASALAYYSNYDLILALQKCLDVYKKDKNLTDEDLGIKSAAVGNDSLKTNTDTQNK